MGKPPPLVHVGPFAYRVSTTKADWNRYGPKDVDEHWGYTNNTHSVILIHITKDNPALARTILLHEILHACAFSAGTLDRRKRREEDWVTATAPMLLDAMDRSPGLHEWLAGR